MSELYRKMVEEAMAAQRADVETVKRKRGQSFVVEDAKAYLDVVNRMKAADGQSKAVIGLHVDSVNSHYEVIKSLTRTIRPEDDPLSSTTRRLPFWRYCARGRELQKEP